MESYDVSSAQAQLASARRAEAAPWIDYPTTPTWYYPAAGIWGALLTLAIAQPSGTHWAVLLEVAVCIATLAFVVWMRKRRRTMPTMGFGKGNAPTEVRRTMGIGVTVFLTTAAVTALSTHFVGVVAGVVVALLLIPAVLVWYERAFARSAAAVRTRLDSELA